MELILERIEVDPNDYETKCQAVIQVLLEIDGLRSDAAIDVTDLSTPDTERKAA